MLKEGKLKEIPVRITSWCKKSS